MESLYDCVFLKHGIAFGAGALIFLLTIFLVARRIIGFTLSVIFILIALGVALGIEHQDVVKAYINQVLPGTFKVEEKTIEQPVQLPSTVPTRPSQPEQPSTAPSETRESEQPQLRGQSEKQKSKIDQFFKDEN